MVFEPLLLERHLPVANKVFPGSLLAASGKRSLGSVLNAKRTESSQAGTGRVHF